MIHKGRGRPKLHRPDKDTGTPELQKKRHHYITEEVLDAYLRHGIITQNQHWCGIHFRWLYTLRYGIPSVRSVDPTHLGGRECMLENAEWRAERESEFRHAALRLRTDHCFEPVMNVCVYNKDIRQDLKIGGQNSKNNNLPAQRLILLINGMDILEKLWCIADHQKAKLGTHDGRV